MDCLILKRTIYTITVIITSSFTVVLYTNVLLVVIVIILFVIIYKSLVMYGIYSVTTKKRILYASAAIALLTPFTDTVYLPALTSVGSSLSAPDQTVALTVSIYLAAVGIGQICFGPLADRYGRLRIIFGCLFIYEILTVSCIFSPTIEWLIALRTLQGFFVSGTIVSAQAIIADIYEEAERGNAMGIFLAPMLVGPIIAPLCGGILSATFSWRATFVLLAIMVMPIWIATMVVIPETQHWYAFQRVQTIQSLDSINEQIASSNSEEEEKRNQSETEKRNQSETASLPSLMMPWESLTLLYDPKLCVYYSLGGTSFAPMFTSLTVLPLYLSAPPYNLSAAIIGTTYLPVGVAMLLGAIVGGALSDRSQIKYPDTPDGRLTQLLPFTWMLPISTIVFGFSLQYTLHLSVILISQSVLGFGQAMLMPSSISFLSAVYPDRAATAGSVMLFLCFAAAAVSVSISVTISEAIGVGWFFVIIASVNAVSQLLSCITNYIRVNISQQKKTNDRDSGSIEEECVASNSKDENVSALA